MFTMNDKTKSGFLKRCFFEQTISSIFHSLKLEEPPMDFLDIMMDELGFRNKNEVNLKQLKKILVLYFGLKTKTQEQSSLSATNNTQSSTIYEEKKQPTLSKEEQETIKLKIENNDDERLKSLLETQKRQEFENEKIETRHLLPQKVQNKVRHFHHHDDIFEIQPIFDQLETEALIKEREYNFQKAISELKEQMNQLIDEKNAVEKQLNQCLLSQKESEVECKYLQFKWILLMNEREKRCHAERDQLIFDIQKAETSNSEISDVNEQLQKVKDEKERLNYEIEQIQKEKNKYHDKKSKYKIEKKQKQERIQELEVMLAQGIKENSKIADSRNQDNLSPEYKKKIDKLESQLYEKEYKINQLQEQLKNNSSSIQSGNSEQVLKYKQKFKRYKNEYKEEVERFLQLEEDFQNFKREKEEEFGELTVILTDSRECILQQEDLIKNLREDLEKIRGKQIPLEQEHEELKKKLSEKDYEIFQLKQQV